MTYLNRNGWNLSRSGSSEVYLHQTGLPGKPDTQPLFVARFKYARPGVNATAFAKFLTANFTVEEFFALRDQGIAPLTILETKGYVSPNKAYALSVRGE